MLVSANVAWHFGTTWVLLTQCKYIEFGATLMVCVFSCTELTIDINVYL